MAIFSAFTLIRTISLFHLTAAYLFLTAPRMIVDQNAVFMLGESIRVPHITSLDRPNEASAFIAVLLAFLGLADLTAASMQEVVALEYWLSNVPVRLTMLFGLTGYVYLFKEDGMFGSPGASMLSRKTNPGEHLQNSLVFSFGFFEIAMWFWVFVKLREERQALAKKRVEEAKAAETHL